MTRYLLDTHVWLWLQTTPERLRDEVGALLADRTNTLLLSAVSSWEIAVKYRLGKLPLPEPPAEYVPERMRRSGVTPLPIEHVHALRVADLPEHHSDPFDRLLVAQAQLLDVPIVTADGQLAAYEVEIVSA
ncbi:PIN domain nuclease, a component of toxin-antitoxin system (PIN domain) [Modestobacter sp. DSM 44400]|uniref:type II toxin-antitoxin system VapC family toxin n=1 Tax=Modestobacter sp. DSM 44400 TaxID=1550230 RepID=UPI00089B98D7|nr:type II toxin-antitoxin system VapC family toxin [Modestobacter sp. DSM 44400]SDY89281.1 PIN domain nuclease, a component of toxin-antitoxin system (PIN domain) [Modestobacter sp. DSM 44400]